MLETSMKFHWRMSLFASVDIRKIGKPDDYEMLVEFTAGQSD